MVNKMVEVVRNHGKFSAGEIGLCTAMHPAGLAEVLVNGVKCAIPSDKLQVIGAIVPPHIEREIPMQEPGDIPSKEDHGAFLITQALRDPISVIRSKEREILDLQNELAAARKELAAVKSLPKKISNRVLSLLGMKLADNAIIAQLRADFPKLCR